MRRDVARRWRTRVWAGHRRDRVAPVARASRAAARRRNCRGWSSVVVYVAHLGCEWHRVRPPAALGGERAGSAEHLKEGVRSGDSPRGRRVRGALVVSEIALSIVLLAGAGLLIRSFVLLSRVGTGFQAPPEQVLTLQLSPTGSRYGEQRQLLT